MENPEYLENARKGLCPIYGAFDGEKLVALMGMRSRKTHINLVFTKKEHHRKGIATAIFHYLLEDMLKDNPALDAITLNSSPYGKSIYGRDYQHHSQRKGYDTKGLKEKQHHSYLVEQTYGNH